MINSGGVKLIIAVPTLIGTDDRSAQTSTARPLSPVRSIDKVFHLLYTHTGRPMRSLLIMLTEAISAGHSAFSHSQIGAPHSNIHTP